MENDIEKIHGLDLHDLPVKSLKLLFEERKMILEFEKWNDKLEDYDLIKTEFWGIQGLTFEGPTLQNEFDVQEILDITWEKKQDLFTAKLTFYMGSQKPCWITNVLFEGVTV